MDVVISKEKRSYPLCNTLAGGRARPVLTKAGAHEQREALETGMAKARVVSRVAFMRRELPRICAADVSVDFGGSVSSNIRTVSASNHR
jgi:hypothetical protein